MGGKSDRHSEGDVALTPPAPEASHAAPATRLRSTADPAWLNDADEIRDAVIAHLRMSFGYSLGDADFQDLAQEAFAEILRREAQGTEIREPRAFAKRVAWRDARDLLQARGKSEATVADPQGRELEFVEDWRGDPETELIRRSELSRAIEAAERLPVAEQAVYRSRFVDELKPKDACKSLRISRPAYYRHLRSAEVTVAAALEDSRFEAIERELIGAYVSGTATARELRRAKRLISADPNAAALARELWSIHRGAAAVLPVPALEPLTEPSVFERLAGSLAGARDRISSASGQSPEEVAAHLGLSGTGRTVGAAGGGTLAALGLTGGAGKIAAGCLLTGALTAACVVTGVIPTGQADNRGAAGAAIAEGPSRARTAKPPNPALVERAAPGQSRPEPAKADVSNRGPSVRNGSSESVSPAVEPSTPPGEQEFGVPSAAPAPSPTEAPGGAASTSEVQQEFGP